MLSRPVPILGLIQEVRNFGDPLDLALISATQEHGNGVLVPWVTNVLWGIPMVCCLYGWWQQRLLTLDLWLSCLICAIIELSIGQEWLTQSIVYLCSLISVIVNAVPLLLQLECISTIVYGSESFIPAIGQMLVRRLVVLISRGNY